MSLLAAVGATGLDVLTAVSCVEDEAPALGVVAHRNGSRREAIDELVPEIVVEAFEALRATAMTGKGDESLKRRAAGGAVELKGHLNERV